MKKFCIISFFFIFCSLFSFATKNTCTHSDNHSCNDEYEIRYIKKNKNIDSQYQEKLRMQDVWLNFSSNYPNWYVIFNENNQLPHRAFGSPISLDYNNLLPFFSLNNFFTTIDLREKNIVKNDKYINVKYTQYYNSLEVINSNLYAKFTLNNELVSFGLDVFDLEI